MKNGNAKNVHVHDPGPMPPPATYCRQCNQAFPVAVPIIGSPPETSFVQLTVQLADHMQRKHPKEVQTDITAQVNASIAYSAQKILAHFNSTDQGLMEWQDRVRHGVFREMMRGPVSDEKIETKVRELSEHWEGFWDLDANRSAEIAEQVTMLVKSMRDAIEERNLYPEPAQSLVSTI
jgi:hypothetical protein